jgi:hypothetical protein
MKTPNLFFAAALAVLLCSSCTKLVLIPPVPINVFHDLEQDPFQNYLDSVFSLSGEDIILTIDAVAINDVLTKTGSSGTGQAEIGYAFRSSVAGAVTSLGVLLPSQGFQHTVTLWDSASGVVLAQADVPSLDSGKWTYVSLALVNQEVIIQPDHGYIVGFNTLAVGNPINTFNPGNQIYILDGIYDFSNGGNQKRTIIPFTMGAITYEGGYMDWYDTPVTTPLFPSAPIPNGFDVPGICDIGFIPQQ